MINVILPLSDFWSSDFVIAYKLQVSECFVFLRCVLCSMLPVSLHYPLLIATSGFSNVYSIITIIKLTLRNMHI